MDEPTGDLDTKNSDMIMKLLIDLNKNNNITMIMVTHDVGLKSYADRVVKMVDGKVSATEKGTTGRFGKHPKIWVQNATNTKEINIPYEYDGRWKVGDSCLLIIEKYKENE